MAAWSCMLEKFFGTACRQPEARRPVESGNFSAPNLLPESALMEAFARDSKATLDHPLTAEDARDLDRLEAALSEAVRCYTPRLRALQPELPLSVGYGYDSERRGYVVNVFVFNASKEAFESFRRSAPRSIELQLHNPEIVLSLDVSTQLTGSSDLL